MVHSRNDISFLVLRASNQEFIVIRITSGPYLADKLAKANSTDGLADVQERRLPDFTANANFESYQTQSILRGKGGDNEVEGSLDNAVLEIRNACSDVGWRDGDDEDEV